MHGLGNLRCVRCALQLAVNDVLKIKEISCQIKSIRFKIKTAKSVTYKRIFELSKVKIPSLDIVTRWNSTFLIVKSISDNKEFYKTLGEAKFIEDDLWNFIDNFVPSFPSVFVCTKTLQDAQLTFGAFICPWMELERNLTKTKTDLSEKMLKTMEVGKKIVG